jgi:hypothetical protein
MFNFFKNHNNSVDTTNVSVARGVNFEIPQPPPPEKIELDFQIFSPGIDNVRIDVSLSPSLVRIVRQCAREILREYGTGNKRIHEKPAAQLRTQLNHFSTAYGSLLEAVTHQARQSRGLDTLRLFHVAMIHFIQQSMREECDSLLTQLREATLRGAHGSHQTVEQHERAARLARQQNNLLAHGVQLLTAQMRWVENSPSGVLRESLLGARWPVPEWFLFNPLVLEEDRAEDDVCMRNYLLLHQNTDHPFSFAKLDTRLNALLKRLLPDEDAVEENCFNWQDLPDYVASLFDVESCQRALAWAHDENEVQRLRAQLETRTHALDVLVKELRQVELLPFISAAYSSPELYPYFAYALKPYMIFRVLCGDMSSEQAAQKVEVQQKLRKRPRAGDTWQPLNLLLKTKKEVARAVNNEAENLSVRFIRDFIRYRRDFKAATLLRRAIARLHLLFDEQEVRLSQSNGMLQTFWQQTEQNGENDTRIRGHVMLKADIRGSTTIVTELKKRDLNPATHFSLNFFQPINALLATYGAEKVFIEGDAVILAIFEQMSAPEHWLCVARACGLAASMLQVVESQNQVCREHNLPLLEIGIGICYSDDAPTFLYDGDHRITISDAIGKADRLSSCSWALRKKLAGQRLPTHVMVFEQPAGQFKGEKGVTTLRYNLNGIELDDAAFAKLCGEITLTPLNVRFKHDPDTQRFFSGHYPDHSGAIQGLLIRQGRVRLWNPSGTVYPLTDKVYYEVMNPHLLQRLSAAS